MKHPFARSTTTLVGGIAVLALVVALVVGVVSGTLPTPRNSGWAVPLVAGGAVGLLSLFLLAGTTRDEERDAPLMKTSCAACGMQVLEEWRLCPYCGGSSETVAGREDSSYVSPPT